MVFFTRSYEDMVSDGLRALKDNTNISKSSPGSKARFLLDTSFREQQRQHQTFDVNLAQAFLTFADNKFLDFFGDILNVPRIESQKAETTVNNFMFYVDSGTFGDINNGADIAIPSGSVVSTVPFEGNVVTPGLNEQPIIRYITINSAVALASDSTAYVNVRAEVEGLSANVPRNVLRQHSITAYTLSAQNLLMCTNRFDIQTGVDRESDPSYRFRLLNTFKAKSLAIQIAIRLAALSVPGVADIVPIECEQGCGSYSVYIQGLTTTTSPDLLREVNTAIGRVSAYGVRAYVLAPRPLGIEFVAKITWSPRAKPEDIARGYAAIRTALETQLNDLSIGQPLTLSDLIDVLLLAAPLALSIGQERPNFFENVYVLRGVAGSTATNIIRTEIQGDTLTPLYNERIILETSGRHRGIQFV